MFSGFHSSSRSSPLPPTNPPFCEIKNSGANFETSGARRGEDGRRGDGYVRRNVNRCVTEYLLKSRRENDTPRRRGAETNGADATGVVHRESRRTSEIFMSRGCETDYSRRPGVPAMYGKSAPRHTSVRGASNRPLHSPPKTPNATIDVRCTV